VLAARIIDFLNAGDTVVAEVSGVRPDTARCFVRVRPVPKPGVPREERRYLNSSWSMWEYWDFEFRLLVLKDGWMQDEWNYDRYIIEDQRRTTHDPESFDRVLADLVPEPAGGWPVHLECRCPIEQRYR
jgi:hypothetical protein